MRIEEIKKKKNVHNTKFALSKQEEKKGGTDAQLADYMTGGMNRLIGGSRKDMQMCVHVQVGKILEASGILSFSKSHVVAAALKNRKFHKILQYPKFQPNWSVNRHYLRKNSKKDTVLVRVNIPCFTEIGQ